MIAGNGTVEFNEFTAMMAIFLKRRKKSSEESRRQREESELRQAFKVFDIDGDGLIDAHELKQTMKNLGENVTDKDVQAMIKSADKNADNKIDFDGNKHYILAFPADIGNFAKFVGPWEPAMPATAYTPAGSRANTPANEAVDGTTW